MESGVNVAVAFFKGFVDSLRGALLLFYMDKQLNERSFSRKSPSKDGTSLTKSTSKPKDISGREESKVLKRTLQCCALNGGVCWLSICLFYYTLLPFARYLLIVVFGQNTKTGIAIWSWLETFLSVIFSVIWVLPLFLLSKVVNGLWFQDIADSAYRYSRGRRQQMPSFSKIIADSLFSIMVQVLFLMQGMAMKFLPIYPLGYLLSMLHVCLLYSLYAFEYKWFNMGWELHTRLAFIETNWPYFLGFGLPLAFMTHLVDDYIVSGCIFSIFFPLFILSGNEASPVLGSCEYPLKLFSPVIGLSNLLFNRTIGPNPKIGQAKS